MKKNNKSRKGFTIVELVIVIAVIAILAAVLIPTFSNVIDKANNSADLQEARNTYTEYLAVVNAQPADVVYAKGGDQYFKVEGGKMAQTGIAGDALPTTTDYVTVSMSGQTVNIVCANADNHTTTACGVCGEVKAASEPAAGENTSPEG